MHDLEEIVLEGDELEAIRLGDLMNLSQEDAAEKMKISRQTFGRIINSARAKIADGILNGKAIKISENLSGELRDKLLFICSKCGYKVQLTSRRQPVDCPNCSN